MFDSTSRYAPLEKMYTTATNGDVLVYVSRRFLPISEGKTPLAQVTVKDSDRLDLIANQVYNDSLLYWQLADGNGAMNPFDLVQPGTVLQVFAS